MRKFRVPNQKESIYDKYGKEIKLGCLILDISSDDPLDVGIVAISNTPEAPNFFEYDDYNCDYLIYAFWLNYAGNLKRISLRPLNVRRENVKVLSYGK